MVVATYGDGEPSATCQIQFEWSGKMFAIACFLWRSSSECIRCLNLSHAKDNAVAFHKWAMNPKHDGALKGQRFTVPC